ncbi:hypothetical protein KFL_003340130 [Klebsormidium nitens]|uniref:Uncharacterized protein n=1 Tax=Klebsormidium nitens TaxID=105231 RepID=A0A1Y1ICI5_KLENI|nr:hypothetical protein KFL_003340130 [Klebsormidium nitens]|eukprot:GAQ87149.1 hypothetical protein KFL_003340130 [Klebsormidium nitens]
MGDVLQRCAERLRRLDLASLEVAQDFIRRWNEFRWDDEISWLPEEKLWVNFVANNQAEAALFEAEACRKKKEQEKAQREEEETRRRILEESEELKRRGNWWAKEAAKHEELSKLRRHRVKQEKEVIELRNSLQREVDRDPKVVEVLGEVQDFLQEWHRLEEKHPDVPRDKLWASHVANNPTGAAGVGRKVVLEEHLPHLVNGCLTRCRICDQHKPLAERVSQWESSQKLVRDHLEAQEQQERERAAAKRQAKTEARQERRARIEKQVAEARAAQRAQETGKAKEEEPEDPVLAELRELDRRLQAYREEQAAKEADPNRSIDELD